GLQISPRASETRNKRIPDESTCGGRSAARLTPLRRVVFHGMALAGDLMMMCTAGLEPATSRQHAWSSSTAGVLLQAWSSQTGVPRPWLAETCSSCRTGISAPSAVDALSAESASVENASHGPRGRLAPAD